MQKAWIRAPYQKWPKKMRAPGVLTLLLSQRGRYCGVFRVEENLNLQTLAQQNPCHFVKMIKQIMQGWQKMLVRNSGQLLLFPEDCPSASTSTLVYTPLKATGTLQMRKHHFSTSATSIGH